MNGYAETVRRLRERRGLSLHQLASRMGTYHQFLMRIERGVATGSPATVISLGEELGLSDADTDRLLLLAGYAPRDLYGVVASTLGRLTGATSLTISACAESAARNLSLLDDMAGRHGADFNTAAQEIVHAE